MNLAELKVDDEVYVNENGLEYIKEFYPHLVDIAYKNKYVIGEIIEISSNDKEEKTLYHGYFLDDEADEIEELIELFDTELSLTPLLTFAPITVYTDGGVIINSTSGLIRHAVLDDGQLEMTIEDDELKLPFSYEEEGKKLGQLIELKQKAYGNAIQQTYNVVKEFMRPYETEEGYVIPKELLQHLLLMVRIIDKQNRIFNNPKGDLMGESPYCDISGYGLLGKNMEIE
jgi:hypothetical protein